MRKNQFDRRNSPHKCTNISRQFKWILVGLMASSASNNALAADPAIWVSPIQGGEIRFYDWGYSGPNGRTAGDFDSINGFNGASQIQHVITTDPDGLTPDAPNTIYREFSSPADPLYPNANMDAQVNFTNWGYTTVGGSTFHNMQIDADGDYLVKRQDMDFAFYDTFEYQQAGTSTTTSVDTLIDFQPYALSDATGWCGSVTASNPGALEAMAGQVTFDFGFEAFFPWSGGITEPGTGGMQIVQDFQMRSYGSIEVEISTAAGGSGDNLFRADAVVNNTSPISSTIQTDINGDPIMIEVPVLNMDGTPALDGNGQPRTMIVEKKTVGGGGVDENFYNKVSFMGGGVVPAGAWVRLLDVNGPHSDANIVEVLDADDGDPNTAWHQNAFAGYPFLLRADGMRIIDAMDYSLYTDLSGIPLSAYNQNGQLINLEGNVIQDLSAVPVPAAVWLFGSGLIGLIGFARKRNT